MPEGYPFETDQRGAASFTAKYINFEPRLSLKTDNVGWRQPRSQGFSPWERGYGEWAVKSKRNLFYFLFLFRTHPPSHIKTVLRFEKLRETGETKEKPEVYISSLASIPSLKCIQDKSSKNQAPKTYKEMTHELE